MEDIKNSVQEAAPDVRVGFILTREGRAWKEEALCELTDDINRREGRAPDGDPDSGILWHAGLALNAAGFLAEMLEIRPDAYVVLSTPEETVLLGGPKNGTDAIREYLAQHPDRSSWSLLVSNWDRRNERI